MRIIDGLINTLVLLNGMNDLVERVRQECADAYFAAVHYKIQPFGTTPEESAFLFHACFPSDNHFPKYLSKLNPWLPKPLKELIFDPSQGLSRKVIRNPDGTSQFEYNPNQFYIFQYPLNMRRIVRNGSTNRIVELVDPAYLKRFFERFFGGSCITSHFTGTGKRVDTNLPLLVGNIGIMQEVMDHLKSGVEALFDFYRGIISPPESWGVDFIQKNTKAVHIYDLRQKPKELHFTLE